jgi:hypothetical protein
MKPMLKRTLIGLAVVVVGIQLIRPSRENPPVDPGQQIGAHVEVPADVAAMLEASCYDCHSHQTRWPWYSNVAPVSWLVAHHADEGREYVNFDTWGANTADEQREALEEISEVVESGEMPLGTYLPLHPEARLTDAQRQRLSTWAASARGRIDRVGSPGGDHGDDGHDHDDHDH